MDFSSNHCIFDVVNGDALGFREDALIGNTFNLNSSKANLIDAGNFEGRAISYRSSGPVVRKGTKGDDIFKAKDKSEEVYGYEGDDLYIKPNGSCYISYVGGDKFIDMGSGNDEVRFNLSSQKSVKVNLGKGNDKLEMAGGNGDAKANINGGNGKDWITIEGSDWSPVVKGGAGNDKILVGWGNVVEHAIVAGGKGRDIFDFNHGSSGSKSTVVIKDFSIKDGDTLYMNPYNDGKKDEFTYKQKGDDLHIKITPASNAPSFHSYENTYILKGVGRKEFLNSGLGHEEGSRVEYLFECHNLG